jgi:uncharacterized cupin superfamily protein
MAQWEEFPVKPPFLRLISATLPRGNCYRPVVPCLRFEAMRHANVRNTDEVEVREMIKGRHNMRLRQLGKPAGSIALGATLTEVAPSGISFPRHAHYINEEAIYVLSGTGEVRIGDAHVPVRPGDWIALPTGPEHAHQMVNVSFDK